MAVSNLFIAWIVFFAAAIGCRAVGGLPSIPFERDALDFSWAKDRDNRHKGNCGSGPVDAVRTTKNNPSCSAKCFVSYTRAGEQLEYHFRSETDVYVVVSATISSASKDQKILLTIDGNSVGELSGPGLGRDVFRKVKTEFPSFVKGGKKHKLRVTFVNGGVNLCSVQVTQSNKASTVPFIASATDFSWGKDNDMEHYGDCGVGPVDAFSAEQFVTCPSTCYIGRTEPGEWVTYKFRTTRNEIVDISPRIASDESGKFIIVFLDGKEVGRIEGPNESFFAFRKQTIANVPVKKGRNHKLTVKFLTGGVNLCSISVTPKRSRPLTLVAKYDWQDGAKDVSGSTFHHDGVLDEGVVAKNGILSLSRKLYRYDGVNLGMMDELDGAKKFMVRFENVTIDSFNSYNILAGGKVWWVGVQGRELVFNVGGFSYDGVYEHRVQTDRRYTYYDSIDFRFNGGFSPGRRLAIRWNNGDWAEGGWSDPDWWRTFFSSQSVEISDGGRADADAFHGSLGPVFFWANV